MHTCKLTAPGTWISDPDKHWVSAAMAWVWTLGTGLVDAAICLNCFESALEAQPKRGRGEARNPYLERAPFVHARGFVLSLQRLQGLLESGAAMPRAPMGVRKAFEQLDLDLPQLTDIRHAIAHFEERVQGRGRHGPLQLSGGALTLEGLFGERGFVTTAEDGQQIRLEITRATLDTAVKAVQAAIDAFQWHGSRMDIY